MAKKQGLNIKGQIREFVAQREAKQLQTTTTNRNTNLTNNNAPVVVSTDAPTAAGTVTDGETVSRRRRVGGGLSSQLGINA